MNIHHLILGFDAAMLSLVAAYGWFVVVGLIAVGTFIYLRKHKQDVDFAEQTLKVIQTALGNKLGSKSAIIFKIWLSGLEQIKNGNLSNVDILNDFISFVKLGAEAKAVNLTETELSDIRVIAIQTLSLLKIKSNTVFEAADRFNQEK